MEHVISERSFVEPIAYGDVEAMAARAAWCFDLHRVGYRLSFLSLDGRRMVCQFAAPDAESVRNALRQLDKPFERVWTASIHDPPEAAIRMSSDCDEMARVVVERLFETPVDFAEIQAIQDRSASCLERHRVRSLRTYFSTDHCRMICCYAAPDAESVRLAHRQAGMPFERVWSAALYESAK
jgi:hypothetical protein